MVQVKQKDQATLNAQLEDAHARLGQEIFPATLAPVGSKPEDIKDQYTQRYKSLLNVLRNKDAEPEQLADDALKIKILNSVNKYLEEHEVRGPEQKSLRSHQVDAMESIRDFLEHGGEAGWLKLPTGAGKTALFISLIDAMLGKQAEQSVSQELPTKKLKSLVVVPRNKIEDQTHEAVRNFASDLQATAFDGRVKDLSGDVVVTTYQSLASLIKTAQQQGVEFDVVICDEAHRGLTEKAQENIANIPGRKYTFGFTATPQFSERKNVANEFGELIHQMHITEAIHKGILCPARGVVVSTDIDLSKVSVSESGDYNEAELEKAVDVEKRNLAAIRMLQRPELDGQSAAAFCVTVRHAEHLAELANKEGIKAAAVHGGMSREAQDRNFADYNSGKIQMICSVDLLTEGWDAPRTSVALNLRPTRSLVVAEQRAGRALRTSEGKSSAVIIDFIDADGDVQEERPITIIDILGGAVIVPPGSTDPFAAKENEQDEENEKGKIDLKIDGIEVITNEQAIIDVVSRKKVATFHLASIEQAREILKENNLFDPEKLLGLSKRAAESIQIDSDYFSGSLVDLIGKYNVDIKGHAAGIVTRPQIREFCEEILEGTEFTNLTNQRISALLTPERIEYVLDRAMKLSSGEALSTEYSFLLNTQEQTIRVGQKQEFYTGAQILNAIAQTHGLDVDQLAKLDPEAFAAIARLGGIDTERADRLARKRLVSEAALDGILGPAITAIPELRNILPRDFAKLSVELPNGKHIFGQDILDHAAVKNNGYVRFINQHLSDGPLSAEQVEAIEVDSELLGKTKGANSLAKESKARAVFGDGRLRAALALNAASHDPLDVTFTKLRDAFAMPNNTALADFLNSPALLNGKFSLDENGVKNLARWATTPATNAQSADNSEALAKNKISYESLVLARESYAGLKELIKSEVFEKAVLDALAKERSSGANWMDSRNRNGSWDRGRAFSKLTINSPSGARISGEDILRELGIRDEVEFDPIIACWASGQSAGKLIPENLRQAGLRQASEAQTAQEYFRSQGDGGRFVTFATFLETKFDHEGSLVTGKELMQAAGIKLNHTNYRKLVDQLVGESGYCQEFWPLDRKLMSQIFSDSVSAAGLKPESPASKLASAKLSSAHVSEDMKQLTIRDFLTTWYWNRLAPDELKQPLAPQPKKVSLEIMINEFNKFIS